MRHVVSNENRCSSDDGRAALHQTDRSGHHHAPCFHDAVYRVPLGRDLAVIQPESRLVSGEGKNMADDIVSRQAHVANVCSALFDLPRDADKFF